MRIRFHLLLVALGAAIPLAAFGIGLAYYFIEQELAVVQRAALDRARTLLSAVDAELRGSLTTLTALASSPLLAAGELPAFARQAAAVLPSQPGWTNVTAESADGKVLLDAARLQTSSAPAAEERKLAGPQPQTATRALSADLQAGHNGEAQVQVRLPVAIRGQPAFLAATIDTARFDQLLAAQRLPPGWVVAVLDPGRRYVARIPRVPVRSPPSPGFARAIATGAAEGLFRSPTMEGIDAFQAFARSETSGWYARFAAPADVLLRSVRERLTWTVAFALCALLLAGLLAWRRGYRIEAAMHELVLQAGRLERAERLQAHTPGAVAELDAVAAALHQAAETIGKRERALKTAEEGLRSLAGDLERRVEERTAALTDANRELQSFSYTVSHDLRAPLRGIQGYAEALMEDYGASLEPGAREYLQRIVRAGRRMEDLIEDLLAYSRLSRENVVLRPHDLDPIFEAVLQRLIERIRSTGAQVVLERPLGTVLGQRSMLVQVFQNLLDNAMKFVRPGATPLIRVSSRLHNGMRRIEIEDNGIGVNSNDVERIFVVFERLHGDEVYPGTGIGLAIVRRVMERMQGGYGVEAKAEGGSIFWVELRDVARR